MNLEKTPHQLLTSPAYSTAGRKKNEEYIAHLAAIVESSDDAIISKSLDGTIKSWNKGSEKMFGYTAAEAVGSHISLIIPPEYSDEEILILERIRNNETVDHYETIRSKKSGEQFYVSLTVSPLKDQAGNITGVSKIARDITFRKKSEVEKKQAAKLIIANKELVLQNAEKESRAAELIIANKELAFQNQEKENRAAELIIANKELAFQNEEKGKRAAELVIANKELLFQNEEKEKRAAELIIANKELAFQNEEKGKRAAELLIVIEELKNSKDNVRKLNDELEQKVIERTAQLGIANKELESFSYSVSHDLRAPLRAIHGYTKMLKRNYETQLDTEANRLMNNILNNGRKMGQLIDELLNFSRLGRKELIKIKIPMLQMVTNICDELKIEKGNHNIIFHISNLLPAYGDNITIKQVWLNLVSNAIKYSKLKTNPVIEIGSEIKEDEIIYHIKDNGAGFDMRYADKLFGVFQRLHSDEEFEGIGVGLAIVHRIITKHGGRVWAEGKINEGAIFYFTLNK